MAFGWLLPQAASPAHVPGHGTTATSLSADVVLDTRDLEKKILFLGDPTRELEGRVVIRVSGRGNAVPVRLQTVLLSPKGEVAGRCVSDPIDAAPGRTVRVATICAKGSFRPANPEQAVVPGDVATLELEPGESAARAASRLFAKVEIAGKLVLSASSADGRTMGGSAAVLFLKYPIEHG
jgi:hypothetical protein